MRLAIFTIALAAAGCDPATTPNVPKTQARTRDFPVTGIVEAVELDSGSVTLNHDPIPGLMPAMVMDFNPTDRSLLDDLFPGDQVEGTLRASYSPDGRLNALELINLLVTRPAVAAPPPPQPAPPPLQPGQPVPDFAMTTQDGEVLRLSDLRGHVVMLTFIYTRCPQPNFCPLIDRKFAEMATRIARNPRRSERMRLLSVSFDPEHDTPEVLTRHAEQLGAHPPLWRFAVASHDELAKVASPLGLSYAPLSGEIRHGLTTAVIGPDGCLVRLEPGGSWSPNALINAADDL